ncbi:MAG TPA: hypothetical protein VH593_10120 [Ktedonobacteraceae bacterium]|jgi:hypothetical protein
MFSPRVETFLVGVFQGAFTIWGGSWFKRGDLLWPLWLFASSHQQCFDNKTVLSYVSLCGNGALYARILSYCCKEKYLFKEDKMQAPTPLAPKDARQIALRQGLLLVRRISE